MYLQRGQISYMKTSDIIEFLLVYRMKNQVICYSFSRRSPLVLDDFMREIQLIHAGKIGVWGKVVATSYLIQDGDVDSCRR